MNSACVSQAYSLRILSTSPKFCLCCLSYLLIYCLCQILLRRSIHPICFSCPLQQNYIFSSNMVNTQCTPHPSTSPQVCHAHLAPSRHHLSPSQPLFWSPCCHTDTHTVIQGGLLKGNLFLLSLAIKSKLPSGTRAIVI